MAARVQFSDAEKKAGESEKQIEVFSEFFFGAREGGLFLGCLF